MIFIFLYLFIFIPYRRKTSVEGGAEEGEEDGAKKPKRPKKMSKKALYVQTNQTALDSFQSQDVNLDSFSGFSQSTNFMSLCPGQEELYTDKIDSSQAPDGLGNDPDKIFASIMNP